MKDNSAKQALLRKFLADECTDEELKQLFDYMQHDNLEEYDLVMQEVWHKLEVKQYMSETAAERLFATILSKVREKDEPQVPVYKLNRESGFKQVVTNWYRLAAVFVGILIVASAAYYRLAAPNQITQTTPFGQISTVTLPDKSVVMLNGNSSIQYASNWDSDETREVWLRGEAFFSIKHTTTNQKFLVHTLNKVSVEVLGTEFNVNTRNSGNQVVLVSGKIQLNLPDNMLSTYTDRKDNSVEMQPGQLVRFSNNAAGYIKKAVNPSLYCSWRNKELIFDNTPLREVITLLQDTYGLKVQVADRALIEQQVSGSTPNESADLLLTALSRSLSLKITRKADTVRITR